MIARAAVKLHIDWRNKTVVIPCHRHADAYEIMYELGCIKGKDYQTLCEGFLDENNNFLTRQEAYIEAERCNQLKSEENSCILYSENLW